MEGPDDFFVAGDLDDLRIVRAGVAVSDHEISVLPFLNRRDPGEGDAFEVILLQFPDNFFPRCHFENAVSVPGRDEIIAVLCLDRRKTLSAKRVGAMALFGFFAEEGNREFPDRFPVGIVFLHGLIGFVRDEIVTVFEAVDLPGVGVGAG